MKRSAQRLFLGFSVLVLASCGYHAAAPARAKICVPFVRNDTPQVGLAGALTKQLRRLLAMEGARVESTVASCSSGGMVVDVHLQRVGRKAAGMTSERGHLVEVDGLIALEAFVTVSEAEGARRFEVAVSGQVPRASSAAGEDLVTSARSQDLTEVLAREIARRLEFW